MAAQTFHMIIEQGSDYRVTWPALNEDDEPQDTDGWSARGQIRPRPGSATLLHDLTPQIALVGTEVRVVIPGSVSATWTFTTGAYDLELVTPEGVPTRFVEGNVIVRSEVTR